MHMSSAFDIPEKRKANKKAIDQRYYARHRTKLLAQARARYHARRATMTPKELAEHNAKAAAAQRRYAATHAAAITAREKSPEARAKSRAWQRQRRTRDIEASRARDRVRYAANPAASLARSAAWAKRNPEKASALTSKRYARLRNVPINDATAEQRQAVIDAAHGACAYCPFYRPGCTQCLQRTHKLAVEHVTAIANGGPNTLHNLVACCKSCNSKKRLNKNPIPVQPLLL
jgi:5-methylcytosine-specific restriction endonuclease McrA